MGTKTNTDTVPAMLTPGEFVIKRDSAQKIGYDALELMNETGKVPSNFQEGGNVWLPDWPTDWPKKTKTAEKAFKGDIVGGKNPVERYRDKKFKEEYSDELIDAMTSMMIDDMKIGAFGTSPSAFHHVRKSILEELREDFEPGYAPSHKGYNSGGKVSDNKKHGGKMAGYLKNKFLNGMLQGYQKGGAVQVAQNNQNQDINKYLEGALKAKNLSESWAGVEGDKAFDVSQKYGYGGMLLDQLYQIMSGQAGTEYDSAQDIYGEGAPRPANITDIVKLVQESKEDGGAGVKIPRGYQSGGEVYDDTGWDDYDDDEYSDLWDDAPAEVMSSPGLKKNMSAAEQLENLYPKTRDAKGDVVGDLKGNVLGYLENILSPGYKKQVENVTSKWDAKDYDMPSLRARQIAEAQEEVSASPSILDIVKNIVALQDIEGSPDFMNVYQGYYPEHSGITGGKTSKMFGSGVKGMQEGGPVPFQISPNATLSRRATQIDVEPSTGGKPINILDIVQRTGPDATTPGPFTGSSEKNMIDGLVNYIMSPKYDSRTGKHRKEAEMLKKDIDTVSVFGEKSSDSAIKNILNYFSK